MGFGICVIGCIALVTDIIGGGIIAYPLLAYGMKKASTLNVNFFYAAVAALFCIPHSALVLFSFLGVIDENTVFYQASYCLFYAIYLLFHIFFFLGASQVYRAGKAEKYASRAMSRLYMTAVYVVWAMKLCCSRPSATRPSGARCKFINTSCCSSTRSTSTTALRASPRANSRSGTGPPRRRPRKRNAKERTGLEIDRQARAPVSVRTGGGGADPAGQPDHFPIRHPARFHRLSAAVHGAARGLAAGGPDGGRAEPPIRLAAFSGLRLTLALVFTTRKARSLLVCFSLAVVELVTFLMWSASFFSGLNTCSTATTGRTRRQAFSNVRFLTVLFFIVRSALQPAARVHLAARGRGDDRPHQRRALSGARGRQKPVHPSRDRSGAGAGRLLVFTRCAL
ncbi:MAG: hypothetical protein ACLUFV_11275 [Acutalibacteraceae bacterium]